MSIWPCLQVRWLAGAAVSFDWQYSPMILLTGRLSSNSGWRSAQVTRVLNNLARRHHLASIASSFPSPLFSPPLSAHVFLSSLHFGSSQLVDNCSASHLHWTWNFVVFPHYLNNPRSGLSESSPVKFKQTMLYLESGASVIKYTT